MVGLPSDLEVNLHFLSLQKQRGNSCWPQTLVIVRRGPEIGVFSQHGADGDSMRALQTDKSFRLVRTESMDGRSLLL